MLQRSAVKLSFPAAHVPDVRTRSGRLWFCETCLSTTESAVQLKLAILMFSGFSPQICQAGLLLLLLGGLENLERAQQALVDAHHGTGIVEFAAVVRSGEQGDELALREEFVAVLDDLMRAADQIHIVFLQEAGHNVRAECEGDTTIVLAPSSNILVRVGPQKVAEKTAVRDLAVVSKRNQPVRFTIPLTSVGRITRRICSMELRSGLKPPCIVKIFSSMIAAIGRQLKQSVNVFHSLML